MRTLGMTKVRTRKQKRLLLNNDKSGILTYHLTVFIAEAPWFQKQTVLARTHFSFCFVSLTIWSSRSVSQEDPCLLCNRKVRFRVDKNSSLNPDLS